ncbi:NAD-dependent dehydratase [Izhakiella australiensis]|uniref:NAD-dependent dehydratase n=1 Tax=Izhakiella australiensis TaxID=1926881 RepID=A0A1S8YJ42_9GAMM|nr:SDR family oxidoreductase [Izhakiella australiensis]OON38733.1 NAD-dependent dehydratase [Izhakiella australiensis]
MKVFVTGASGYIGQAVVKELLDNGHSVLGMARSEEGIRLLQALGAEVHQATLEETDKVLEGVRQSDGVIHLAFNHDFSRFAQNCADDCALVSAMCEALEGTQKPLLITSGILIVDLPAGALAKEDSPCKTVAQSPRAASEDAVRKAAQKGVRAAIVRLSQVHDVHRQGLISYAIALGKEKGELAWVGSGESQIAAVHLSDAARLYRLALERAEAGAVYHGVGESGVKAADIVRAAGKRLGLPVRSIAAQEAGAYFGWLNMMASSDMPASSERTQQQLNWTPRGPGLLHDLDNLA